MIAKTLLVALSILDATFVTMSADSKVRELLQSAGLPSNITDAALRSELEAARASIAQAVQGGEEAPPPATLAYELSGATYSLAGALLRSIAGGTWQTLPQVVTIAVTGALHRSRHRGRYAPILQQEGSMQVVSEQVADKLGYGGPLVQQRPAPVASRITTIIPPTSAQPQQPAAAGAQQEQGHQAPLPAPAPPLSASEKVARTFKQFRKHPFTVLAGAACATVGMMAEWWLLGLACLSSVSVLFYEQLCDLPLFKRGAMLASLATSSGLTAGVGLGIFALVFASLASLAGRGPAAGRERAESSGPSASNFPDADG